MWQEKLFEKFGVETIKLLSCFNQKNSEEDFRSLVEGKNFKTIIEIGTNIGVTTSFLSQFCNTVITVDIKFSPLVDKICKYLKVDNVEYYVIRNEKEKQWLLEGIDFDFVFIDGDHDEEPVRSDFEICKKCGKVLFHDYYPSYGVTKVVDSLPKDEVTFLGERFAYWEKK